MDTRSGHTYLPVSFVHTQEEGGRESSVDNDLLFYYFSLLTLTHFYGFLWGHLIHRAVFAWPTSKAFSSFRKGEKKWRDPWKIETRIWPVVGHKRNWKQYHPTIFTKSRLFLLNISLYLYMLILFLPHLSVTNLVPVSLHQKSVGKYSGHAPCRVLYSKCVMLYWVGVHLPSRCVFVTRLTLNLFNLKKCITIKCDDLLIHE